MKFEWNRDKNQASRAKHGVSFDTASLVFDDPHHLSIQDRHEGTDERWQTLCLAGGVEVLLVAHTYRESDSGEEVIRIIFARKATARERRRYDQSY